MDKGEVVLAWREAPGLAPSPPVPSIHTDTASPLDDSGQGRRTQQARCGDRYLTVIDHPPKHPAGLGGQAAVQDPR